MDQLLHPIQTKSRLETGANFSGTGPPRLLTPKKDIPLDSPEEVLKSLSSKPDLKLLTEALRWLHHSGNFNIKLPGPRAAQIIFVLVNEIIPNYWQILDGEGTSSYSKQRKYLIICLRSVAGVGALVSRLRLFSSQQKDSQSQAKLPAAQESQPLYDCLSVLENVLAGDGCVASIWQSINACLELSTQKFLQWKELLSLLASGKLLSIASEACLAAKEKSSKIDDSSWIGDGNSYATWLGQNVQYMNRNVPLVDVEGRKSLSQLLSKALNLGYQGEHADDPKAR